MSNIDKQALREAAEKASTDSHTQDEWFHYLCCSHPTTMLALLDENLQLQRDNDSREAAALAMRDDMREAREKLKAAENNLIDSECHVAELEESLRDKQALLEAAEKRIAELKVRTVSVKLPDNCEHDVIAPVYSFMYKSGFEIDTSDYNTLSARVRDEVQTVMRRTLRAAGIVVKGE
ncbi:ead/Ea22-like family protein [Citrobacter freundii]|uniref:ead/Ea22-like family protein n=1 Tax=Citrobacter freundii TaxID=546 RepID=UPI00287493CD|nr:ead/Ea22-like family protein [Citrobacter freundii]MDS0960159.1 ead/Ea22-like family protein [Citrobacter freundii]